MELVVIILETIFISSIYLILKETAQSDEIEFNMVFSGLGFLISVILMAGEYLDLVHILALFIGYYLLIFMLGRVHL